MKNRQNKIVFALARRFVALGLALLALGACQSVPEQAPGALRTAPDAAERREAPANAVRYAIDPDRSDIRFLVYRAGPLARLGHNHVIQAKNVRGEIRFASEIRRSTFSITMPAKDFAVDEASARGDEGEAFAVQPDAEAIAGTTANMIGEKVLDGANYPNIEIESIDLNGPAWGPDARIRITLHGQTREMSVPIAFAAEGNRITVTTFLTIKQTDFGITPMSVLGGGLQVDDAIRIRARIVAVRK